MAFITNADELQTLLDVLFLNPRIGTFDPVYFDSGRVDPNGVCSAVGTHSPRDTSE